MLLTIPRMTDDHRLFVLGGLLRDLAQRGTVVGLDRASERVNHHFFRHRRDELIAARREDLLDTDGAIDFRAVEQRHLRVDRLAAVAGAPGTDAVVVLQREAPGIHARVTVGADRVGPVALERRTNRERRAVVVFGLSVVSMFGGGGGTGEPRMLLRTHLPRSTGEVRLACEVTVRMLP